MSSGDLLLSFCMVTAVKAVLLPCALYSVLYAITTTICCYGFAVTMHMHAALAAGFLNRY
jgi:hypothetical protein